jgi:putative Ig domain-containing protein
LAGTPTGPQGDYSFTITAANGISPDATQAFILTIAGAPVFTSANTTTFTVGTAGSFLVTTSGAPSATVQWCTNGIDPAGPCTMPSWLTFMDNEDGTSTLGGTPPAGSEGTYTFYFWATTGVPPDASQLFTLIVNAGSGGSTAPVITSVNSTTFNVGEPGSFQFTATGSPTPTLSETGALPNGLIFVDNRNGTAALAGVPAAGTMGSYPLTITAANGVSPNATQNFILTVNAPQTAPAITSANSANFTVGSAGSFMVTATGSPTPALSYVGTLPGGVTFTNNSNGTATLAGTPDTAAAGKSYPLIIKAANGVTPDATQNFTLTVNGIAPAITSGSTATFNVGSAGSFTVTATGSPTPTLSYWGALPSGVTFTDNGNSTATLAGTSATAGSYLFTITAANGVSPNATQNFTLTISGIAPAITSGNTATFTVGSAGSFTVTATGSPTPQLIAQGALPSGVIFVDNHNGTATLAGTPAAGTTGSYPLTITAANGVSPNATQAFTLTVNAPRTAPAITSASSTGFTVGTAGSFMVTTTGSLPMTLSETGALPSGVTFADNGNGTATLAGTPTAAGSYPFTITAVNGVSPNATQNFTLTVSPQAQPLTIVAPAGNVLPNGTAGQSYTYQLQAQGGTQPYTWSLSGRLPSGLRLSTAGLISGRAGNNAAGTYTFTVRVTDRASQSASKSLTLTINARPPR